MHLVSKLLLSIVIAYPLPAMAYTAADAKACMPDAFRLCATAIPDHSRVAACLHAKQQQLSEGCAEALTRYMGADSPPHHRPKALYQE